MPAPAPPAIGSIVTIVFTILLLRDDASLRVGHLICGHAWVEFAHVCWRSTAGSAAFMNHGSCRERVDVAWLHTACMYDVC